MNKTKKYLAGSAVVIALSVCAYVLNQHQEAEKKEDNRVSYVDGKNNESKKNENLTPDQVSKKEGIEAEQIVVKITDQGYVTSHGDHFHYYNGKVPFDAIFSEELVMKDPSYQLRDEHIVNEIKGGYIIKVDGKYYVYLKNASQAENIRTKEQIEKQKQEHTSDQKMILRKLWQLELKDVIQLMTVMFLTLLISLRIQEMLISFPTEDTSIIFLRVICQRVN